MLPALMTRTHVLLTATAGHSPSSSSSLPTPTPTPTPASALENTLAALRNPFSTQTSCSKDDISVCGLVYRMTGHKGVGQFFQVLFGVPLRLLLIVVLAVLVRRALHRLIDRLADRVAAGPANGETRTGTEPAVSEAVAVSPLVVTRREARARTLASVLSSATTVFVVVVATLMVLQELDISTGPLVAGVSVLGVALGLGAQGLVRDVVSGMFMIAEDQYGVGDVVDVGEATGAVEAVGLRITRLRDVNGTVWYVRNGEILRVGNQSQGWARAVLDINVGLGEDIDRAEEVLLETAGQLRADPAFGSYVLDEPEVWGVESLSTEGVLMRVVVKTVPLQQWPVARELRRRIKYRFDADGIEMKSSPHPVVVDDDQDRQHRPRTHDAVE